MKKNTSNKLLVLIIIILLVLVVIYLFFPFQNNNFLKKVYSPICGIKGLYQGQEYLPAWCLEKPEESKIDDTKDNKVGLANPAAVKCIEDGYTLENYTTEAGAAALCIFDDDSICNQWAYFRGECSPGQCQKKCDKVGTNKEGYYNSCTGELLGIELCAPEEDEEENSDQPEDDSPAVIENNIKVVSPITDQQLSSPFTVKGQAMVFENKVYIRVIGRNNNVLIEESTDVKSADIGEWGDFSIDINYEFDLTKEGKVEVYSKSAKNGVEENLISIPVKF